MSETPVTRPTARKRATPAAAAKPATRKAAPAPAVPAGASVTEDGSVRIPLGFVHESDTKNYAKWVPPQGSGCVGALYVPLGTTDVRALLIGPSE